MAISSTQQTQILKVVAGLFNAAPGGSNLTDLANAVEGGMTIPQVANFLAAHPLFVNGIMAGKTTTESQTAVLMSHFGLTPGNSDATSADAQAEAFFTSSIDSGVGFGSIVYQAGAFLSQDSVPAAFADTAALLDNKALVAKVYSENNLNSSTDLAALQAVLAGVTSEGPSTEEEAEIYLAELDDGPDEGPSLTFTQQLDNLMGDSSDNVFQGPVTQNETGSGALSNTFETGDSADGVEGRNSLEADLIATGTIGNQNPAISAETHNIQEVYFRAQNVQGQNDDASNTTFVATIDAEKMNDVEQWWTQNSRSDVRIEDIRSRPDEVTFGMRLTDPDVGYQAYFNPIFMEGDLESESALTLRVQEITDGQDPSTTELENITVREINFNLAGESYTLDTPEMREANTWADLEAAIADALAADPALADLVITHEGGGVFVIDDNAGREFTIVPGEALIFGATADIDVRNRVDVGQLIEEGQTRTDLIVDGVGNGSRGGSVNIAAMSGDRGVEVIDVMVDRTSHLTSLSSVNSPNTGGGRSFDSENQLEEVFLTHVTDDTGVPEGSDINEVQTLDFTGGFGDLADSESITISFADGEYTFTNDTGAAILEADIDDAIIADAANAPDAFDIATGGGDLVELTANNPGDMPDTVVTASDGANVPDDVVIVTSTTGETADSESTNGGTGDFFLGTRTQDSEGVSTTTDDRLNTNGLTDVRVFDATGFTSELKLGASLTDSIFDKYLLGVSEPVQFSYLLGDGGSNLNLAVDNLVAGDPDFMLETIGGSADDRINLSGLAVKQQTTVDGGTEAATDTLEITTSSGWAANENGYDIVTADPATDLTAEQTSFGSVANIDNLVIATTTFDAGLQANEAAAQAAAAAAGFDNTTHDLVQAGLSEIPNIVIATDGQVDWTDGANPFTTMVNPDTRLVNLDAENQDVIISGKNQTLGAGNNNNDQSFGEIQFTDTTGETLDLNLANTARVSGVLTADAVTVDNTTGNVNEVRTLNVHSDGTRNTSNVISTLNGNLVNTFNLMGTQALTITDLASASNSTDSTASARDDLTVDGSTLEGDLYLGVTGAVITAVDDALGTDRAVTLTGTEGDSDSLNIRDGVTTTNATTIAGFETVLFGADGAPINAPTDFNATNVSDVNLYDLVDSDPGATIALTNLRSTENVQINALNTNGTSIEDDVTLAADNITAGSQVNVNFANNETTANFGGTFWQVGGANLNVQDFQTISLDMGGTTGQSYDYNFNLNTLPNPTTGDINARTLEIVGGLFDIGHTNIDSLTLNDLDTALTSVDFSGYDGRFVTQGWNSTIGSNADVVVNEFGFQFDVGGDNTVFSVPVGGGVDTDEVQTLDFTAGFGDLADGESITIDFAGGSYTFTNDTGAAILQADIDNAIIADAANAPDAFGIATGGGDLVQLTASNPGNMPPAAISASDVANVPGAVAIVEVNGDLDAGTTAAYVTDVSEFLTKFVFTEDAYTFGEVWQIDNFQAFDAGNNVDISNQTQLDLRPLGVDSSTKITIDAGDDFNAGLSADDIAAYTAQGTFGLIGGLGAGDTVITSNDGLEYTIVLTGVDNAHLLNENIVGIA